MLYDTMLEDSGVDLNRNFGVHWSDEFMPCNEDIVMVIIMIILSFKYYNIIVIG